MTSHEQRPERRFSNRVADYVRYRPSYPPELLAWLRETIGFSPAWRVADIGSGTGIFARLLLDHGNIVYGVEPNQAMRAAAEEALAGQERFVSVAGNAEATTLSGACVELIAAAQAFHWFEPMATRREFQRILMPGGRVLVVFNSRRNDASPFMRAYDDYLTANAVDYGQVDHRLVSPERLHAFLGDYHEWKATFSVFKEYDAVRGLSSSSSYVPSPSHPKYAAFYDGLRELVAAHAVNGRVEFFYETNAYLGTVD